MARRIEELRVDGGLAAKAKADLVYLEEFKKSKLAILMKQAEAKGFTSIAAQEREARASDDYIEFLKTLRDATEESEKQEWGMRISLKGADLYQTSQIAEMSERKLLGRNL
jgi:hypothetical protein